MAEFPVGRSPAGPVILFEAVSAPHRSAGPRGLAVLTGLLGFAAAGCAGLFLWLGAWPVLGVMGLEIPVALLLLLLHHRNSGRVRERVVLTDTTLQVSRTDRRGRQQEIALEPYWTRLVLRERPGRTSALLLAQRRAAVEIGSFLGEGEKRDLAEALGAALRRYREPVFDNPQLRSAR